MTIAAEHGLASRFSEDQVSGSSRPNGMRCPDIAPVQPVSYQILGVVASVVIDDRVTRTHFGIIAHSAYKLTTKTIGRDWLLWAIYPVTALVTIITQSEQVLLFIAAG